MSKIRAAVGSLLFLILAPGLVGVLLPWLITGWEIQGDRGLVPFRILGVGLIAAGALSLGESFVRFVNDGRATPAPIAAPEILVVRGQYKYVRNPMYLAVASLILGQAVLFEQPGLLIYLALFMLAVFAFARLHEEPALTRRLGQQYIEYKRDVPGWWPRKPKDKPSP